MVWPFTWLGVIAGALLASIPGALLGGVLGQILDQHLKLTSWAAVRELLVGYRAAPNLLLFMLLGRLAKSDGVVEPSHIQKARDEMRRLSLDSHAQRQAIEAFNRGKVGRQSFRLPLKRVKGLEAREQLLRACWRMAWADGKVGKAERELLNLWGQWLGFNVQQVNELGAAYAPNAKQTAAAVNNQARYRAALNLLGVSESCEKAAVKRAYRKLLSQHHPDKLAGAGASAERLRRASAKTSELHEAYQYVCKVRGF